MKELNSLGISKDDITELVANKIADDLELDNIQSIIDKKIEKRINTYVAETLTAKVDAVISAEMEKLLSKEIVPINIFGEKTGKSTTISGALHQRAKEFWDTKVDAKGEPYESYGSVPRHEFLFRKIVNQEFELVIKQNITNMVGAFKDAVAESSKKSIQEHINSIIKVKSLGDK